MPSDRTFNPIPKYIESVSKMLWPFQVIKCPALAFRLKGGTPINPMS
ncbi:hypothetical protein COO91_10925 (plasmid) [Nostoc flagelliforme CCNUN1]|uniref:Uncharacterized protein n=1 Tax=Nostoc flagelliforme CCNUN1 TaxID=2038116 RepID=A0A2K8TAG7_9NOSO|nr:hypothetical protein COO91_10925 [Nostoc flagelliforme CCNUN1]